MRSVAIKVHSWNGDCEGHTQPWVALSLISRIALAPARLLVLPRTSLHFALLLCLIHSACYYRVPFAVYYSCTRLSGVILLGRVPQCQRAAMPTVPIYKCGEHSYLVLWLSGSMDAVGPPSDILYRKRITFSSKNLQTELNEECFRSERAISLPWMRSRRPRKTLGGLGVEKREADKGRREERAKGKRITEAHPLVRLHSD